MAGITLEIAKRHLEEWLEAELVLTTAQSYTLRNRTLTRANLTEVRNSIKFWNDKVNELENIKNTGGRNRIRRVVPRDL